jgi:REP element-mobilizing transposase RayT
MQFDFFDPQEEVYVHYRRLPHWEQPGAMAFITWRTIDSIPEDVLRRWRVERTNWLRRQGIDPLSDGWQESLRLLSREARREYHERFTNRWMEFLDKGHGACVLRRQELSAVVANSLLHADNREYVISDFVVMPNHVHVLAQFHAEGDMKRCCKSWKHWTAGRINEVLQQSGRFWQVESFDHLVRSPEQFEFLRRYIAENPRAAGLQEGEYRLYSRALMSSARSARD